MSCLLLSAALFLGACKKDDPEASLPRISREGLNTGGFLLDGVAYPATGWSGSFLGMGGSTAPLTGGYELPLSLPGYQVRPDFSLDISSERAGKKVTVTLFLRHPQVGEFPLNRDTGLPPIAWDSTVFDHARVNFNTGNGEVYSTSSRHTGRLNLSMHLPGPGANLSAGTFEFTAVSNLDPTKTLRVTAGRFDRKQ
jgi:hypothetical protein